MEIMILFKKHGSEQKLIPRNNETIHKDGYQHGNRKRYDNNKYGLNSRTSVSRCRFFYGIGYGSKIISQHVERDG